MAGIAERIAEKAQGIFGNHPLRAAHLIEALVQPQANFGDWRARLASSEAVAYLTIVAAKYLPRVAGVFFMACECPPLFEPRRDPSGSIQPEDTHDSRSHPNEKRAE